MGVEGEIGGNDFSTYVIEGGFEKYGLHGYGKTAREAVEDTYAALRELRELAAADGEDLPEAELAFSFDVGSMFSYYPWLNMSAVARKIGINASLMRKYASGLCRPSRKRMEQIQHGIHEMADEMHALTMSCACN